MTAYVAGFLIDPDDATVVLVRKNRPEWQAGRLNGVGGHVEPGESGAEAMRREFREEAGLDIDTWAHFATVEGPWGSVEFFRAQGDVLAARSKTDEDIEVWLVGDPCLYRQALPNLTWLIPLALYTHDIYQPVVARET
jgi:8-oxo-dGTP diphosphatase